MPGQGDQSIFRAKALRHHNQAKEQTVLPRLMKPRGFIFFWAMMALVALMTGLAWTAEVPVMASGTALVVEGEIVPSGAEEAYFAVFLPEKRQSEVAVGQQLFIRRGGGFVPEVRTVMAVDTDVLSPLAVKERFAGHTVEQPAVVVYAPFHAAEAEGREAAETYLGSVYEADVEVGARTLFSLFPRVGTKAQ